MPLSHGFSCSLAEMIFSSDFDVTWLNCRGLTLKDAIGVLTIFPKSDDFNSFQETSSEVLEFR